MIDDVRRIVIERAAGGCEYCKLPAAAIMRAGFQMEHIRARQHGGPTELDNLAWACRHCNLYKGPNQSAYDPETNQLVRLFHPRTDRWSDHFRWQESVVVGITPIGRATVQLLEMNDPLRVELRRVLS